jgi:hypothetical protein
MQVAEYKEGNLVTIWHDRACAERCGATDIRELPDNHSDILAWIAAEQAARKADVAERSSLRQQLRDETEEQWLARTDTQRQKFILRALKAIEKRI